MESAATTVERDGRATVVRLRGDLVVPAAGALYAELRALARRRDVAALVLDFGDVFGFFHRVVDPAGAGGPAARAT